MVLYELRLVVVGWLLNLAFSVAPNGKDKEALAMALVDYLKASLRNLSPQR